MRFANALPLIAFALLLAGCAGNGGPQAQAGAHDGGNYGTVAAQYGPGLKEPEYGPQETAPDTAKNNSSQGAIAVAAVNSTKQNYTDYCYTTHWKGTLNGTGGNYPEYNRCGNYNYSMDMQMEFAVPFDLAAYLAGKDFNFNDCPGMPYADAGGIGDISSGGSFSSVRKITSDVINRKDRLPDSETVSNGGLYASLRDGGIALASSPRSDAQNSDGKYPHLVADRCTWENGILVGGYYEAILFGADGGGFAYSSGMKSIYGKWAINGKLAGNYTLEREN